VYYIAQHQARYSADTATDTDTLEEAHALDGAVILAHRLVVHHAHPSPRWHVRQVVSCGGGLAREGASAALAVRGARTPAGARRDTPRNAISPAIPSTSTRSPTDIGGPMDDAMTFFKI